MTFQQGTTNIPSEYSLGDFDLEISQGSQWVTLNDHITYRIAATDAGVSSYQQRRITTTSPYYDGDYFLHATLGNVEEQLGVYVYGYSQSHVTENVNQLVYLATQPAYNIRKRVDDHMETWLCQPADYSIDRSHVYMHNNMAVVKLSIPRSPRVSYEVIM